MLDASPALEPVVLILDGNNLAWAGYYALEGARRLADARDRTLRPSGTWGHGVGIAATLLMLGNFLYPQASPFGYNGRYVYTRVEVTLGR